MSEQLFKEPSPQRLNSANTTKDCPFSNSSRPFEDFRSLGQQETLEFSHLLGDYVVTEYFEIIHVLDRSELFFVVLDCT